MGAHDGFLGHCRRQPPHIIVTQNLDVPRVYPATVDVRDHEGQYEDNIAFFVGPPRQQMARNVTQQALQRFHMEQLHICFSLLNLSA